MGDKILLIKTKYLLNTDVVMYKEEFTDLYTFIFEDKYNEEFLYKKVQDYLIDKISSLEFKPGSKIPSERQIAEELNISRMTVKNAISKLVDDKNTV